MPTLQRLIFLMLFGASYPFTLFASGENGLSEGKIYDIKDSVQLTNVHLNTDQDIFNTQPGCNTATFYMRLSAAGGQKITIQEIQGAPNGDFIAGALLEQANGAK